MEKKQKNENNLDSKVKPLADRVLIKEIDSKKENETKSGIILPETVEKENGAHKGMIVAVGEGRYDDGKLIPMKVKIGDKVLFQWGDKLNFQEEEYFIVSESNILAIVK